jgi:hypothetical protein
VEGAVVTALSETASTGLILGGGALGCGLLVLGLTVLAVRRGAKEEQDARTAQRVAAGAVKAKQRGGRPARPGRPGRGGRGRPGPEPPHDPYPRQPYSPQEPKSHQPYSRPYKLPRQEQYGSTNGHRPPDSAATGIPATPYTPPEDEA